MNAKVTEVSMKPKDIVLENRKRDRLIISINDKQTVTVSYPGTIMIADKVKSIDYIIDSIDGKPDGGLVIHIDKVTIALKGKWHLVNWFERNF